MDVKAARSLVKENEAQLLNKYSFLKRMNYLKATDIEVGLLVNFGIKPEVKRKAYDNLRK